MPLSRHSRRSSAATAGGAQAPPRADKILCALPALCSSHLNCLEGGRAEGTRRAALEGRALLLPTRRPLLDCWSCATVTMVPMLLVVSVGRAASAQIAQAKSERSKLIMRFICDGKSPRDMTF